MYNGLIIDELLSARKIQKKELLEYLNLPKAGGGSTIRQIIRGNPTVKSLEPVADFFKISMDCFFNRAVQFTPSASNVFGNGNAVGNGNTIMTSADIVWQNKVDNLVNLIEEKQKRIETLEMLVQLLQEDKKHTKSGQ